MDEPTDLVQGQVIAGRYEVGRLVGEGGMGSVYLARDLNLGGRHVALKALNPEYVGRPDRERRFENEALFSALSGRLPYHSNLAATLDSGRTDSGRPFIVMEYVDGPAISGLSVVVGRALTAEEVCHLARGVASALRVIHEAGLVHRDLTPTNVLVATVGGEWVPKVIDLSHAASVSGPKLHLGHPRRLTKPHEVPGTAGYMSPEQVESRYPAAAMDIFSFGVMLWEVLADRHAYRERDRGPYCELQRDSPRPPPSLREHRSHLPRSLYRLIEECTSVEPHERPTAQRILEHLDVVALELNTPGVGVANDGPPRFAADDSADVPRPRPRHERRGGNASTLPLAARSVEQPSNSSTSTAADLATPAPSGAARPRTRSDQPAWRPHSDELPAAGRPRRWAMLTVVFLLVMTVVAALGWLWLRRPQDEPVAGGSARKPEATDADAVEGSTAPSSASPREPAAAADPEQPERSSSPSPRDLSLIHI